MSETPEIAVLFFAHLDEVYGQLTVENSEIWVPEKIRIEKALKAASFKVFESHELYQLNDRARLYPLCISDRLGGDVYRVYFNEFSKKVYVDLNSIQTQTYFDAAAGVVKLGSEIVRSLMFTDPTLLGEEPVTS